MTASSGGQRQQANAAHGPIPVLAPSQISSQSSVLLAPGRSINGHLLSAPKGGGIISYHSTLAAMHACHSWKGHSLDPNPDMTMPGARSSITRIAKHGARFTVYHSQPPLRRARSFKNGKKNLTCLIFSTSIFPEPFT